VELDLRCVDAARPAPEPRGACAVDALRQFAEARLRGEDGGGGGAAPEAEAEALAALRFVGSLEADIWRASELGASGGAELLCHFDSLCGAQPMCQPHRHLRAPLKGALRSRYASRQPSGEGGGGSQLPPLPPALLQELVGEGAGGGDLPLSACRLLASCIDGGGGGEPSDVRARVNALRQSGGGGGGAELLPRWARSLTTALAGAAEPFLVASAVGALARCPEGRAVLYEVAVRGSGRGSAGADVDQRRISSSTDALGCFWVALHAWPQPESQQQSGCAGAGAGTGAAHEAVIAALRDAAGLGDSAWSRAARSSRAATPGCQAVWQVVLEAVRRMQFGAAADGSSSNGGGGPQKRQRVAASAAAEQLLPLLQVAICGMSLLRCAVASDAEAQAAEQDSPDFAIGQLCDSIVSSCEPLADAASAAIGHAATKGHSAASKALVQALAAFCAATVETLEAVAAHALGDGTDVAVALWKVATGSLLNADSASAELGPWSQLLTNRMVDAELALPVLVFAGAALHRQAESMLGSSMPMPAELRGRGLIGSVPLVAQRLSVRATRSPLTTAVEQVLERDGLWRLFGACLGCCARSAQCADLVCGPIADAVACAGRVHADGSRGAEAMVEQLKQLIELLRSAARQRPLALALGAAAKVGRTQAAGRAIAKSPIVELILELIQSAKLGSGQGPAASLPTFGGSRGDVLTEETRQQAILALLSWCEFAGIGVGTRASQRGEGELARAYLDGFARAGAVPALVRASFAGVEGGRRPELGVSSLGARTLRLLVEADDLLMEVMLAQETSLAASLYQWSSRTLPSRLTGASKGDTAAAASPVCLLLVACKRASPERFEAITREAMLYEILHDMLGAVLAWATDPDGRSGGGSTAAEPVAEQGAQGAAHAAVAVVRLVGEVADSVACCGRLKAAGVDGQLKALSQHGERAGFGQHSRRRVEQIARVIAESS